MAKQQYILHLSSKDSINVFPDNLPSDFTVDIGKTLQLAGNWQVELLSFKCCLTKDQDPERKNLYVFTDIAESSYMKDNYLPVIANFYLDGYSNKKKIIERVVEHPHSLAVVPFAVQRIRIYIKDQDLNTPSFCSHRSERTEVTLRLFRK